MLVGDEYGGCGDDKSDGDVGAYGLYVCSRSPLPFFLVQRPTTTFDSQVFYTCRSSLPMFWGSSNKLRFVTDRTTQVVVGDGGWVWAGGGGCKHIPKDCMHTLFFTFSTIIPLNITIQHDITSLYLSLSHGDGCGHDLLNILAICLV